MNAISIAKVYGKHSIGWLVIVGIVAFAEQGGSSLLMRVVIALMIALITTTLHVLRQQHPKVALADGNYHVENGYVIPLHIPDVDVPEINWDTVYKYPKVKCHTCLKYYSKCGIVDTYSMDEIENSPEVRALCEAEKKR